MDSSDEDEAEEVFEKLENLAGRGYMASDVGAQIIAGYIGDIATRAIKIKDERLIELLKGLKVLKETQTEGDNSGI